MEVKVETGLRWGELTELRPKDIDFATRALTVSRVIIELNLRHHPEGGRFLVKDYLKDREHRSVRLSKQIARKIQAYVSEEGIKEDDCSSSCARTNFRAHDDYASSSTRKPSALSSPSAVTDTGR